MCNIDIKRSIVTNLCGEETHYYEGENITLVTINKQVVKGKIKELKEKSVILITKDVNCKVEIPLSDLYLACDFDEYEVWW